MSKLPGYFFLVIGIAGVIFFYTYNGNEIESKELWMVFSFFMIIIGGFLLIKQKIESIRREFNKPIETTEADKESITGDKPE